MLGKIFHKKVFQIKTALQNKTHPFTMMLEKLRKFLLSECMPMLSQHYPETQKQSRSDYVEQALCRLVTLLVDALILFYAVDLEIRNERDLKRDLFYNLIVNLLINGEMYFMLHNVASLDLETEIVKLNQAMTDRAFLENHLALTDL